eukprot:UN26378
MSLLSRNFLRSCHTVSKVGADVSNLASFWTVNYKLTTKAGGHGLSLNHFILQLMARSLRYVRLGPFPDCLHRAFILLTVGTSVYLFANQYKTTYQKKLVTNNKSL